MSKNIGVLIKDLRKSKNLTQQKLADLSNISRTYLSDVENNRCNPSIRFLKKISVALSNNDEKESYNYFIKFIITIGNTLTLE